LLSVYHSEDNDEVLCRRFMDYCP